MLSQRSLGASGKKALPSDDEFNRVSFLSHFDGANNGVNNVFDDGSTSNHTITANGNVTQGSFGPFARPDGEWGMSKSAITDYISFPAIDLTGLYTMQFWFFPLFDPANIPTGYCMFYGGDAGKNYIALSNGKVEIQTGLDAASNANGSFGSSIKENEWCHLLISRNNSNVYSVYVNGTAISLSNATQSGSFTTSNTHKIGWGYSNSLGAPYILSNFRITKTVEVTSNFTPTTSPLTNITNTKILTCQSNRFVDNSSSALTLTANGNVAVSSFGPFLTSEVYDAAVNGASAYFGSGTDYLRTNTVLTLASTPVTIECWVYPSTSSVVGLFDGGTGETNILRNLNANSISKQGQEGTGAAFALKVNAWSHLAIVVQSGNILIYTNGVYTSTGTYTGTFSNGSTFTVGTINTGGDGSFNGYISDFAVYNTVVYTGNFTPPTAPLTAITNTKLLLNMADGQAIDSAAQNNLTLIADSKLSNTQAKFGDTSLKSDGTGDYAYIPSISIVGDFTIEGFFYFNANPAGLFDLRDGSKRLDFWYNDTDGTSSVQKGFGGYDTGYFGVDDNTLPAAVATQWLHVAVCRIGSVVKLYHNGTLKVTHTHTNDYPNGNVKIGYGGGTSLNGFVDDVRISKMARYTSNFTPPSEPFADKGQ